MMFANFAPGDIIWDLALDPITNDYEMFVPYLILNETLRHLTTKSYICCCLSKGNFGWKGYFISTSNYNTWYILKEGSFLLC